RTSRQRGSRGHKIDSSLGPCPILASSACKSRRTDGLLRRPRHAIAEQANPPGCIITRSRSNGVRVLSVFCPRSGGGSSPPNGLECRDRSHDLLGPPHGRTCATFRFALF